MLSSYDLLELLDQMPERGAFKKAARGGAWSEEESVWVHIANEIARLRASFHAVHGGKKGAYDPMVFLSIEERLDLIAKEEAVEEAREGIFAFADFTDKISPASEITDYDDLFDE